MRFAWSILSPYVTARSWCRPRLSIWSSLNRFAPESPRASKLLTPDRPRATVGTGRWWALSRRVSDGHRGRYIPSLNLRPGSSSTSTCPKRPVRLLNSNPRLFPLWMKPSSGPTSTSPWKSYSGIISPAFRAILSSLASTTWWGPGPTNQISFILFVGWRLTVEPVHPLIFIHGRRELLDDRFKFGNDQGTCGFDIGSEQPCLAYLVWVICAPNNGDGAFNTVMDSGELPKAISHSPDLGNYCSREKVQIFPCFLQFMGFRKEEICLSKRRVEGRRKHEFRIHVTCLPRKLAKRKFDLHVECQPAPLCFDLGLSLMMPYWSGRTAVGYASCHERHKSCDRGLPLLQMEIVVRPDDYQCQYHHQSDRGCYSGPFDFFQHCSKLPQLAKVVERSAE